MPMNSTPPHTLPRHVAVIMDGNGRWAKQKGLKRVLGHEKGASAVRKIVTANRELNIPWLTLYAFSEENWQRPKHEIRALMSLLKRFLKSELPTMQKNGIRLNTIGRTEKLPSDTRNTLRDTMAKTKTNTDMVLTLALSYGGRQEIIDAIQRIGRRIEAGKLNSGDVSEELISNALYTRGMPDPDLLIRTSGEYRISNFLLWQLSYTELYITSTLWPDFNKAEYLKALEEFQQRDRRFGDTKTTR
ncbi:MAG: isoprenyl transferase [Deltaproteobacteria bacterium]|nr:isoprenyl transferase [Deltaproteobacteria bacterium]